MKKAILALSLFFTIITNAQISIGKKDFGSLDKFDSSIFQKFKSTTTIFILSNSYDKEVYNTILKETWTITPFEIVSPTDFDYRNYLTDKYSFAHLRSYCWNGGSTFFINSILDFYILDLEKINKKFDKVNKDQERFIDLILDSKINIAAVKLSPNVEILATANKNFGSGGGFALVAKSPDYTTYSLNTKDQKLSPYRKEINELVYSKNSFTNISKGYLKNYLQKVNYLIKNEQFLWLYGDFKVADVKRLANETLYLPANLKMKYNPGKFREEEWDADKFEKIIKKYKYKTQFVDQSELDKKIESGDDFLYLRHVRVNSEKFIEIVNGKTGDVVYHNYKTGFSEYNIKDKDFEDLNEAIEK